jgi:hypothetical protein
MKVRSVVTPSRPRKTHLLSATQRLDFGVSLCRKVGEWKLATGDQDCNLPGCVRCVVKFADLDGSA